ncbi:uncharacterized protein YqhO-like [Branchiostoma floridae x Branchiostoma belcheri]
MGIALAKPVAELPDDLGKIARKYRAYNFPFENLVLEGGGAKGIAYIGAMKVLEDAGIIKNIKRFAGCSAGAVTAGLMSLGMTSNEIVEEIRNVNMESTLKDSPWWSRGPLRYIFFGRQFLKDYGVYPGDRFLSWYGKVIHRHLQKHHGAKRLDENINLHQVCVSCIVLCT